MSNRSREGDALAMLFVGAILGTGVLVFLVGKVLLAAIREGARVHAEYAGTETPIQRMLTWSLIALVAAIVLGSILAVLYPASMAIDVTGASWTFLTYTIVVAVAGWKARRSLAGNTSPLLDDYLDFSSAGRNKAS